MVGVGVGEGVACVVLATALVVAGLFCAKAFAVKPASDKPHTKASDARMVNCHAR